IWGDVLSRGRLQSLFWHLGGEASLEPEYGLNGSPLSASRLDRTTVGGHTSTSPTTDRRVRSLSRKLETCSARSEASCLLSTPRRAEGRLFTGSIALDPIIARGFKQNRPAGLRPDWPRR